MATYNRAHLIGETIDSILNQYYKSWECLIIDDGSTDNTAKVLLPYLETDDRFKYYKRTEKYKKGLPGSRNQGLDLAKGDYIIFFDDDDLVHPENLGICQDLLQKHGADFCRYNKKPFTGQWNPELRDEIAQFKTESVGIKKITKVVTGKIAFASCCVMWRKNCFENNRFHEDLMYAEEWECYTRILMAGFEGISIDQVLYYNRKHEASNTGEFRSSNSIRKKAKIRATKLVILNLTSANVFNGELERFFVRLAIDLQSFSILKLMHQQTNTGIIKKLKYRIGFIFYPLLKPVFRLKGKLK